MLIYQCVQSKFSMLLVIQQIFIISYMSNDSQLKTQSLLWNTPQSSIKQGNKAQYSVCILVAACARDYGITEAWR